MKKIIQLSLVALLSVFFISANAQPMARPGVVACSGKTEGAACSFVGKMGKAHEGTCKLGPKGKVLACVVPAPQASLDACNGKTTGTDCSFMNKHNKEVNGTCRNLPRQDNKMACVPRV